MPDSYGQIFMTVVTTALTLTFGALIFFIKRYIDHSDKHAVEVDNKFKKIDDNVKALSLEIRASVQKVGDSATDLERSALQFQKQIHKEIFEVQTAVSQIKTDTFAVQSSVVNLQDTVMKHQNSLSLGAKAMVGMREEMNKIKTVITQIGPDAIMVGQKKNDKA